MKPVTAVLCLSVATVSAAAHAEDETWLPNLRAERTSPAAWYVQVGEQRLEVRASAVMREEDGAHWQLTVAVPRELRAGEPDVRGGRLGDVSTDERGRLLLTIDVDAAYGCSIKAPRVPVTVVLHQPAVRRGAAASDVAVPVDWSCLLGDVLPTRDARALRALTLSHEEDPLLDALLAAAPAPRGDLQAEVTYLRDAIRFSRASIQSDPVDVVPDWIPGRAYMLSPSETARYGGDCEDYTILTSLYLARRGFDPTLAFGIGHVWVEVPSDDGTVIVDQLDIVLTTRPHASRARLLEPAERGDVTAWYAPSVNVPARSLAAIMTTRTDSISAAR